MIRREINELLKLGAFPASRDVALETIQTQEDLLRKIVAPVTDDEARELIKLFGPDDYFGGAWTLLHLIETAPHWPLADCLSSASRSEWIARLASRATKQDSPGRAVEP